MIQTECTERSFFQKVKSGCHDLKDSIANKAKAIFSRKLKSNCPSNLINTAKVPEQINSSNSEKFPTISKKPPSDNAKIAAQHTESTPPEKIKCTKKVKATVSDDKTVKKNRPKTFTKKSENDIKAKAETFKNRQHIIKQSYFKDKFNGPRGFRLESSDQAKKSEKSESNKFQSYGADIDGSKFLRKFAEDYLDWKSDPLAPRTSDSTIGFKLLGSIFDTKTLKSYVGYEKGRKPAETPQVDHQLDKAIDDAIYRGDSYCSLTQSSIPAMIESGTGISAAKIEIKDKRGKTRQDYRLYDEDALTKALNKFENEELKDPVTGTTIKKESVIRHLDQENLKIKLEFDKQLKDHGVCMLSGELLSTIEDRNNIVAIKGEGNNKNTTYTFCRRDILRQLFSDPKNLYTKNKKGEFVQSKKLENATAFKLPSSKEFIEIANIVPSLFTSNRLNSEENASR